MPINKDRIKAIFESFLLTGNDYLTGADFDLGAKGTITRARAVEGSEQYKAIVHNFTEAWKAMSGGHLDHKLTAQEFEHWFETSFGSAKSFEDFPVFWKNVARAAFKGFDVNGDGKVSREQYERVYKMSSGSDVGVEEGYEFIKHLGGGEVNLSAWEQANYHAIVDADEKAWKAYPFHAPKHAAPHKH
jgi:hypothetical protein